MAKRTQVILVSDISGEEIVDGGKTVAFSYSNTDYTIDLTDSEAKAFDKAIRPYVEAATRVTGRSSGSGSRRYSGSGRSKEELANIRAWLQENGHEVSERGRIRSELLEKYDAAH